MPKRNRFYVPVTWDIPKHRECDKCGKPISVDNSPTYWNPNPRAKVHNICASCFETYTEKRMRYGHA